MCKLFANQSHLSFKGKGQSFFKTSAAHLTEIYWNLLEKTEIFDKKTVMNLEKQTSAFNASGMHFGNSQIKRKMKRILFQNNLG